MPALADLFTLSRRTSVGRRTGWVGVDVGSAAVKLAEVERRGGGLRLVRTALVPRSSDADPREPDDDEGLGGLLARRLADGRAFSGKTAACVLSMSATPLRTLELPPGEPDEQGVMAAQELSESSESDGRPVSVGCWPAPGGGKEGLTPIYALSVDEDSAVAIAEELLRVKLRARLLDGLPFCLARAVRWAEPEAQGTAAALDWGHSTATFVVARDGQPRFVRVFRDCGFARTIEAVRAGLGLSSDDARQLLVEFGLPGAKPGSGVAQQLQATLSELVAEPLNRLADELNRTLGFLNAQLAALAPQRLWLFGGGGTVVGLAAWIAATTGVPTEPWTLPGGTTSVTTSPLFGPAIALSALGCDA